MGKLREAALAAALLVMVTACGGAPKPAPAPETGPPAAAESEKGLPVGLAAIKVADVKFVRDIPPLPPGPQVPRPLFGARAEDRPALERLLKALAAAKPADPTGAGSEHRRVQWLDIQLTDGRRLMVRDAWNCTAIGGPCTTVPGKQVIAEGESRFVVASPDLEAILHKDRDALMPPVDQYTVDPAELQAGGPVTVKGDGWPEAQSVTLSLEQNGTTLPLGSAPVTFGAFQWSGTLPAEVKPGEVYLNISLDKGARLGIPVKVR